MTQYFPPETGAPATRMRELTERWNEAGHDVTVLTSAPDYPEGELFDGYQNAWVRVERRNGVRVVMTKTLPASNAETLRRMIKFAWCMIATALAGLWIDDSPDVVLATSPQPLLGISAIFVGRLQSAKVVFEVRDLWPESIESVGDFDSKLGLLVLDRTVRAIYRLADRVVMVSQAFKNDLVAAGVDPERLWYHPNGVDLKFFDDERDVSRLDADVRSVFREGFVVSYVGTIGRAHGLEVVLDAAELLRDTDVRFVLVGFGSELEWLKRKAKERDLKSVVFVGRRPKTDVPKVHALSDVSLVHLKDEELFRSVIPSKMFESMAAALPVVLGVKGEAARILAAADAGIAVEPEDPDEIARAVRDLYDDRDERERLGRNGRGFVAEEFTWDAIADNYRRNIESLIAE